MKKLFLILMTVVSLLFMGCPQPTNEPENTNDYSKLAKIKNFEKYTALGVGNKNTARNARSLSTEYITSCGLFGQNPDGTYELLIFEDEEGHEVEQSYYIKNYADYDNFLFLAFVYSECELSSDFGMGDYTYCVNKSDGKMYNIGDKFESYSLRLVGINQYNAFVTENFNKLYRLSFENDLLKIEEIFDFTTISFEIKIGVVDKFGTYANNLFYINKDDSEITRFSEGVEIKLGYNDRIYIGNDSSLWFDNGNIVTSEFIPVKSFYNYKDSEIKKSDFSDFKVIKQIENVYFCKNRGSYFKLTFSDNDSYEIKDLPSGYKIKYATDEFLFYVETGLVKYNVFTEDIIETYDYQNVIFKKNTFTATNSNWDTINGYVDSDGNVHADMTEYDNESIKVTFVSALN